MKLLLIQPGRTNLGIIMDSMPLGLAYLSGSVKQQLGDRIDISLFDTDLNERMGRATLEETLERIRPDVVGVTAFSTNFPSALYVVKLVRKLCPDCCVVIGGPHVTVSAESAMQQSRADYGFVGEGEVGFPKFLALLLGDEVDIREIPGLVYPKDSPLAAKSAAVSAVGTSLTMLKSGSAEDSSSQCCSETQSSAYIFNKASQPDLDAIAPADYSLIDPRTYAESGFLYANPGYLTAPILTTRGCPYGCTFCSADVMNGKGIRTRSAESVLAEIDHLYKNYDVRGFSIIDDNFTFNMKWCKQLLTTVLARNYEGIRFATPNGVSVSRLDPELLRLMKRAGWGDIIIAPETGSKRTMEMIKKGGIDLDAMPSQVRMIHDAGLTCSAFMILGYPKEKLSDMWQSIRFAIRCRFDRVSYSLFQPLPGTRIYDYLIERNEISPDLLPSGYNKTTYVPEGLTKFQLKAMYILAFLLSNCRPGQLFKVTRQFGIATVAKFAMNRVFGKKFEVSPAMPS